MKTETHKLRFSPKMVPKGIREGIANIVSKLQIKKGKVQGRDEDGIQRTFKILENPDSFGDYEYEYLADEATLNLAQIEQSPFFDQMLDTMNRAENNVLFQ